MLTLKNVITVNLIIINLFIEGSLISAQALFSLGALFGATWIHLNLELGCGSVTYTRLEVGTFSEETFWVQLYIKMKTFLIVHHWASKHILGRQH